MNIQECEGYKKLLADVEKDIAGHARSYEDCHEKLDWIVGRAEHYAEKLNLDACDILNAWEKGRNYWYMNYYQECEQPTITAERVRVFETSEDLRQAVGTLGFRCPMCGGISRSPYECDSGLDMAPGKKCDWKSWGLFKDLGKGIYIYVKEKLQGQVIFMPIAWEKEAKS